MSVRISCDRCDKLPWLGLTGETAETAETDAFKIGWTFNDIDGYLCPICTVAMAEANALGDSQTTTADMAAELTKK